MKNYKIIATLLALLMCVSALFASCGSEEKAEASSVAAESAAESKAVEESSKEQSEEVSVNPYIDENGTYSTSLLPEFNSSWGDYGEFRVLVYSDETQKTYYDEDIEPLYATTDTAISDGVTKRNDWIYDTYGIKVKAVAVADVKAAIDKELVGGLDTFDAAMPFMPACVTLAQDGNLYDLAELDDYIHLEAPWWDQNATAAMSIGDNVYFTAGDMTIMQKIVSSGIAFNKTLMSEYFPDFDIYEAVAKGEWTLDVLYSMCKEITRQIEDDDVMDEHDLWGIMDTGPSFFYGCGEQLITKDADNYPILSLGSTDRSITVAKKVLELSVERKTWMGTVDDFTNRSGVYNTIVQVFGENRSLFMALHFSAVKKLRPYGVDYGIVPAAKYDTEQDEYYTKCSAAYAYGICIPLSVKDKEFSAYMLELMCIGGKNYVSDTYYNVVLKSKDLADEKSEAMLDIIFDGIVYDPAVVYGFSGLNSIFTTLISANSTDIVSKLEGMKSSINSSIEDIIESYENQ